MKVDFFPNKLGEKVSWEFQKSHHPTEPESGQDVLCQAWCPHFLSLSVLLFSLQSFLKFNHVVSRRGLIQPTASDVCYGH